MNTENITVFRRQTSNIRHHTSYFIFYLFSVSLWLNLVSAEQPVSPTPVAPVKQNPAEPGDLHSQAVRITQLLPILESTEPTLRQQALSQLLDIGIPVIPFIVNHLKDKGIYVELTRQIMERSGFTSDFLERELKELKSFPAISMTNIDQQMVEKYFYGRYLDALRLCQQERYEDARNIVKAIITLEGNLAITDRLKLLLISVEERIIQSSILMTQLLPDKPSAIYEVGDQVNFTFRIQNVARYPIQIALGQNPAVLYIVMTVYSPQGDYNTVSRMEELKLPADVIDLKPGEKKEFAVSLSTATDLPNSLFYRTYTVSLAARPNAMKSQAFRDKLDKDETLRTIVTPEVMLRFFPPDVAPVMAKPFDSLETALTGGVPLDIFLCALLVPDNDKDRAIRLIFNALEKNKQNDVKLTLLNCLKHLTGLPFELDENTWRDWYNNYKKK